MNGKVRVKDDAEKDSNLLWRCVFVYPFKERVPIFPASPDLSCVKSNLTVHSPELTYPTLTLNIS